MPSKSDLELAVLAAAYAFQTTPLGSSNLPGQVLTTEQEEAESNRKITAIVESYLENEARVFVVDALTSANRLGNCDELSACAYVWLARHGVHEMARLVVQMRNEDDLHSFVLIGRMSPKTRVHLGDLCDRDDVVICDPWAARFLAADKLPNPGAFTGQEYRNILSRTGIGDEETEVWISARRHRPPPVRMDLLAETRAALLRSKRPPKKHPALKRSASHPNLKLGTSRP